MSSPTPPTNPLILFVCVHNAGRSQMAAAFAAEFGRGKVLVRSAGTEPVAEVHPLVVQAMREEGIDLTSKKPRRLTDQDAREADVVVTMGCGDACPVYPGKRYEDWDLADPATLPLEGVREVRDKIRNRVEVILQELEKS